MEGGVLQRKRSGRPDNYPKNLRVSDDKVGVESNEMDCVIVYTDGACLNHCTALAEVSEIVGITSRRKAMPGPGRLAVKAQSVIRAS